MKKVILELRDPSEKEKSKVCLSQSLFTQSASLTNYRRTSLVIIIPSHYKYWHDRVNIWIRLVLSEKKIRKERERKKFEQHENLKAKRDLLHLWTGITAWSDDWRPRLTLPTCILYWSVIFFFARDSLSSVCPCMCHWPIHLCSSTQVSLIVVVVVQLFK